MSVYSEPNRRRRHEHLFLLSVPQHQNCINPQNLNTKKSRPHLCNQEEDDAISIVHENWEKNTGIESNGLPSIPSKGKPFIAR